MKKSLLAPSVLVTSLLISPLSALADDPNVNARIQKLEQELALLKRQVEVKDEKDQAAAEKIAGVELGRKGLKITSPDKNYELSLRGNFQIDNRQFLKDKNSTGKNEFLARRLRPVLEARAGDASFRLMPDFAGSSTRVFDAHADYKLYDELQFRIGKFKTPVSLERLQSPVDMLFIERGHPSNLAPSRDFGVMAYGNLIPDQLEYQIGVFNGNQDLGNTDSDDDDKKDYVARIFAHPFRNADTVALQGLGVGVAGSVGEREGGNGKSILGTYKTPGQQDFFRYRSDTYADGTHWRLYPQAYWYYGNLGVLAEYAISNQSVTRGSNHGELQHTAWQVEGSYAPTGEDINFKGGIKPAQDFNLSKGGIGAWELVARAGGTDVDNGAFTSFADRAIAASSAQSYGGGINWYLNENFKLALNYEFTTFTGGNVAGTDRADEHFLVTRSQFRF
ncbi:MAG: porin [Alphaproteobacteria bacterium]|nr:porin [Alphaproteobacteria bacterium]